MKPNKIDVILYHPNSTYYYLVLEKGSLADVC